MASKSVVLKRVKLPQLDLAGAEPSLPADLYTKRLERARARMAEQGLTHLLIWGDREHSASLAYFTNVDPRFEEAALVLGVDTEPAMLLGNEDLGFADRAPFPLKRVLFQSLSLLGQPRDHCTDPVAALREAGLANGAKVGLVGMKYYEDGRFDLPHYIVEAAAEICGRQNLACATAILLDPQEGLRNGNEAEQIARFEWAATKASQAVREVAFALHPGETEHAAMARARFDGAPLSCHPMLTTGRGDLLGLSSPTDKVVEKGDRFSCAVGLQGGLSCRAGFVAESEDDLSPDQRGYLENVCFPYFSVIATWYESIHCGASGGEIYDAVEAELAEHQLGIALNPGHLLHLDEWTHTPFTKNSACKLRSGMAIQCDNIITTPKPYHGSNVEDGIALADPALRAEIEKKFPATWARIETRRKVMKEQIGIAVSDDLLPLSNIQAALPPFSMLSDQILVVS